MSGIAISAITDPSIISTIEWITLCGWITTEISRGSSPNNHRASITSRPLFIRVAESIVILLPIRQVGWLSACSTVIDSNSSLGSSRKGPPDAVKIIRLSPARARPSRHWKIALCSLSTGSSRTPRSRTARVTSSPAITSTSLLAKAISLPAWIAARVGRRPRAPTSADITSCAWGWVATAQAPSMLWTISTLTLLSRFRSSAARSPSATETSSGRNRSTWATSKSRLRPAAIAATRKRSGKRLTTSRVVTPTEPVEPSIEIVFIARCAKLAARRFPKPPAEPSERHQREVVSIEPVTEVEMARKAGAGKFVFVPRAGVVLPLGKPLDAPHERFTDAVLAGEQTDNRPRGLGCGADSAAAPRRILIGERALAPSAVGILSRFQPIHRALDPRLIHVVADRAQP